MRIAVFGCGYVGLTTAVGLAEMGNDVIGIDTDAAKIKLLHKGQVPFFEPGLQEMLTRNLRENRLVFSTDPKMGIESGEIIFCAVGTPPLQDHRADLSSVLEVAKIFARYAGAGKMFINKSTVPVGTSEEIRRIIQDNLPEDYSFYVVSNPEFLREGSALQDFFTPDRIIIGLEKEDPFVNKILVNLYRPMVENGVPIVFTDIRSAEVIKYASNAYLATRVSFMNELANFCEKAGSDIKKVAKGMGLDKRIGSVFLEAGIGFGGSCLPKDLTAFVEIGRQRNFDFELLRAVQSINQRQPGLLIQKLQTVMPDLKGKTVAVWGLSFKAKTDDLREAPSLRIISELLQNKVNVRVFDPVAMPKARAALGKSVSYADNYYSALDRADALFILTEWDEFRNPDYAKMKRLMRNYYILDGRNILESKEAAGHGFYYFGVGRPGPKPIITSARRIGHRTPLNRGLYRRTAN